MFSQFNHYALEDFPGFPGMPGVFNRQYRCHSVAFIHRDNLESGGKIILPPSALDQLARLRIEYPMLFQLLHNSDEATRKTHCGVLEFVAEEGNCYLPYWMMQHLLLEEGDLVTVRSATLPKGTFVRLRPHDTSFLDISNPRAVLENALRNFSCLTKDDVICIKYNSNNYYLDVLETKPGNAISIVEADVEVDFAAPLNYKEPTAASSSATTSYTSPVGTPTSSASMPIPMRAGSGGSAAGSYGASNGMNIPGTSAGSTPKSLEGTSPTFAAFTGSGFRLDGKRQQMLAAGGTSPAATSGGMVFGRSPSGNVAFGTSPMATSPQPPLSGTTPPSTGMVFGRSPSSGGIQRTAPAAAPPPGAPPANANGAAGDKKDPNFQAFSGKGYSLRG